MRRKRCKYVIIFMILLYGAYAFFGVGDYIQSKSFEREFDYPLNIDIKPLIKQVLSGKKPSVKPINYYPYKFLTNSGKCRTVDKLDLFIIVKSALNHFENRQAIRKTYGQENTLPGRATKILFFVGIDDHKSDTQMKVETEMAKYKDIIQMNFIDAYFNNTIKTVMSLRWAYEHCSTADFYLFTDDDMYISVPNLIEYVENSNKSNEHLYAGYMFKSGPQRIMVSKWRVDVNEYPWDKWPPYITAGAYVVSKKTMKVLYVATLFIKHFRFDDIYLGIVAKKAGLDLTHCDRFYFYKKRYTKEGYRDVIASHGYEKYEELVTVWNEQNSF